MVALRHVGSSPTRNQTCVSCIGRWILYHWATRKAQKPFVECFGLGDFFGNKHHSLMAQGARKNRICLQMQEMQVQTLGWVDPLEKETTTHSSILVREIPWTEESGGLQSIVSQKTQT